MKKIICNLENIPQIAFIIHRYVANNSIFMNLNTVSTFSFKTETFEKRPDKFIPAYLVH